MNNWVLLCYSAPCFNNSGGGLCGEVRPKIHGGALEALFIFQVLFAMWVANSPSKCSWRIKFATERSIRQTHQKTTNGVAANRPVANPRYGHFLQWFMTSVFLVNMTYENCLKWVAKLWTLLLYKFLLVQIIVVYFAQFRIQFGMEYSSAAAEISVFSARQWLLEGQLSRPSQTHRERNFQTCVVCSSRNF